MFGCVYSLQNGTKTLKDTLESENCPFFHRCIQFKILPKEIIMSKPTYYRTLH